MWLGKPETNGNSKECLFADLYQEVKSAAPSAQLSYTLRCRLEKFDNDVRAAVCSKTKEGCSPLFVACKRGNVEVGFLMALVWIRQIDRFVKRGYYTVCGAL